MFKFKKKTDSNFYIVSLLKKEPFHYKRWGTVLISAFAIYITVLLSSTARKILLFSILGRNGILAFDFILVLTLGFILFKLWQWYFKKGKFENKR